MNAPPTVSAHPNATVATGSGGLGVLVVYLLGATGVDINSELGAVIASGTASLSLLIGKRGISGLARMVWKGSG